MNGLEILIPIIGVSIPLAVAVGIFIIKPIVGALGKATAKTEDPRVAQLADTLEATQDRLARIERVLTRIEEAQNFNRQLGQPIGSALPREERR